MRGGEPHQTLLRGIAKLSAFKQLLFVWFQWYLECGFIKTLDKHWTHPVSVCSALHFRGLCIVAATTLQIFVGIVKGQARVWDQVLKLTEAPLQHSVWSPSPMWDCFIELFLRHPLPPLPPLYCLPPFTPLKDPCLYYCFHTVATSQERLCVAGVNRSTYTWSLSSTLLMMRGLAGLTQLSCDICEWTQF